MDYVAEKLRTSRQAGEDIDKYIVVYFDYAGESDVPPKLDVAIRYQLMSDILNLYCHLHGIKCEIMAGNSLDSLLDSSDQMELVDRGNSDDVDGGQVLSYNGFTEDTFSQTEAGDELRDAIVHARTFFKENPDWIGEILEAVGSTATPTLNQKDNGLRKEEKGKLDNSSTSEETESQDNPTDAQESSPDKNKTEMEDPAYIERLKRRMKEKQQDLLQVEDGQKKQETSTENVNDKNIQSSVTNGFMTHKSSSLGNLPVSHSSSSSELPDDDVVIPDDKPLPRKLSRTISNPNDGDILRKEFQLNSPDVQKKRNTNEKCRNSRSHTGTALQKMNSELLCNESILSDGSDDDLQLKRDIEFIQNYDVHHAPVHNHGTPIQPLQTLDKPLQQILGQPVQRSDNLDPIVLDLDLSEYTPPEDFITLENHVENGGNINNDCNGHVNGLHETAVTVEPCCDSNIDTKGYPNPFVDNNANKLGVTSMNHFVIDFVDPSVKRKPDPMHHSKSSTT